MELGHASTPLYEAGAPTFDLLDAIAAGPDRYAECVGEDVFAEHRQAFLDELYDIAAETVDGWKGRAAVPYRASIPETGRRTLIAELEDAGFEVVASLPTAVAAALGYWKYTWRLDPGFDMDKLDGGLLLAVDFGNKFIEAAVVSAQVGHLRVLGEAKATLGRPPVDSLFEATARLNDLPHEMNPEDMVQVYALKNGLGVHFDELAAGERESAIVEVPLGEGEGTREVAVAKSSVFPVLDPYVDRYGMVVEEALADAGVDSLELVDHVVCAGLCSRWLPVLRWWYERGGEYVSMDADAAERDADGSDATVRFTIGINPKQLPAMGASALGNGVVNHTNEIKID